MKPLKLLLFSCFIAGCATGGAPKPTPPVPIVEGIAIRAPGSPQYVRGRVARTWREIVRPQAPLDVTVAQAFFEEDRLKITIHVTAKTELAAENIAVQVLGLREGDVIEDHVLSVGSVYPQPDLKVGDKAALVFTLRSHALTEYQVRCSWGDEARKLLMSGTDLEEIETDLTNYARATLSREPTRPVGLSPHDIRPLTLEDVVLSENSEPCEFKPCNIFYVVHAGITNHAVVSISGVQLALGLYWVNEGALPIVPSGDSPLTPNEELIDLEDLLLPPGATKNIRVKVDRSVPVVPGGRFIPHLRILPRNFRPSDSSDALSE